LLSGFQEGFKRLPILLEHPDELDPISHLGIAGNHGGGDQDGSFDGKLQIQISPDWEWEHCLDVAAAQAQIGSIATNPPAARVSLYFDRHTHFYAYVFATVIPVAVAHGLWPSLRSAHRSTAYILINFYSCANGEKLDVTGIIQNRRQRRPSVSGSVARQLL
jgi:hypothetical protein